MKERDYYVTPKSTAIMRFLWNAAGGDRYLLERATYSDQIKYMCLGGIIVSTGVMAMLAGGYAFFTIFSPKDENGWILDSPFYSFLSCVFGIIWGLIIFNIDRFIVTSTGKGDGTEKITWNEFTGAIPRIIMGVVIAITISMPMEIRIFQTEIQAGLIKAKQDQGKIFRDGVENEYKQRLSEIDIAIPQFQNPIDTKKTSYLTSVSNAKNVCPSGGVNCSVGTHRQLWAVANTEESDWKACIAKNQPQIDALNSEKNELLKERKIRLDGKTKDGEKTDGLAERIKQMHKQVPWETSLFITLLFLVIELTPIFFKLMLTKTPYDYLTENRDDLIRAEMGIEVRYDEYKDKKGIERHLIINHDAERMIFEKSKLTEIQKELTNYALQKYKVREQRKIDENLDEYISTKKKDNSSHADFSFQDENEKPENGKSNDDISNKNNNGEIGNNEKGNA